MYKDFVFCFNELFVSDLCCLCLAFVIVICRVWYIVFLTIGKL